MDYAKKEHSTILEARDDSLIFVVGYLLSIRKTPSTDKAIFIKNTIDSLFYHNQVNTAFERHYISLLKEIVMTCPWNSSNKEITSFIEEGKKTLRVAEWAFLAGKESIMTMTEPFVIPEESSIATDSSDSRNECHNEYRADSATSKINYPDKNNIRKIKEEALSNIKEGVFSYVKKYLVRILSGYKKSEFIDTVSATGFYLCGDREKAKLDIQTDKIAFSVTGEIQLIGDEDILQFHNQFVGEETITLISAHGDGEKINATVKWYY